MTSIKGTTVVSSQEECAREDTVELLSSKDGLFLS